MKFNIDLSKFKNLGFKLESKKPSKKTMSRFLQKVNIKRSRSSSLSLSKKDFILLSALLVGLEGYGLYNLLISPTWQDYTKFKISYEAKQLIAANFEKDMGQKDQYLENLKLLDYKYGTLTKVIPYEIPQEEIVLVLNKLAKERELEINGLSLSTISYVSKKDYEAGKTSSEPQDEKKVVTTTSVAGDVQNGGQGTASAGSDDKKISAKPNLSADMVILEDVDIAFSGSYGSLYNFISDLEKSEQKIIVKEISTARGEGNVLKGSLKLQYVGYVTPEDESTYTMDTPETEGKANPFLPYSGFLDKVTDPTVVVQGPEPIKSYAPNFYLLLNTFDDNAPKVIMGDYSRNGTELYSNSNDVIKGKLAVSGSPENLTYSYSLGGRAENKNASIAIDEGKLRLEVISQPRKGEQDKVGLTLDVENKTDYPLEIKVINDDLQVPRFKLGTQAGSVTISR
ncbi:hypothetical protein DP73_16775 [Desulfosporosinus sp. HMP52]|uniref:hypothetical protein n=1 Tax=Desulfosporosinus sp. HMP52 TaxID=1487923 RepID=UPI00051F8B4C|nr:hypothetical protein [Desulfosporosinus sp. HMP52]KGK86352.1 hypothetical protein DP73_16775 [Desulfosporosinus sp. HMP52]